MFDQKVVWYLIQFLGSLLLGREFTLIYLGPVGMVGPGVMGITFGLVLMGGVGFAVHVVLCLVCFRLFNGLSCGVWPLLSRRGGAVHVGGDSLNVVRHVGRNVMKLVQSRLLFLWMTVTYLLLLLKWSRRGVRIPLGLLRSRVMLLRNWCGLVRSERIIASATRCLVRLLSWRGGVWTLWLLMPDVTFLESVVGGDQSCCCCIGLSLPLPVLWLIMMVAAALRLTLWCGLLVPSPRSVELCKLSVTLQCYLA